MKYKFKISKRKNISLKIKFSVIIISIFTGLLISGLLLLTKGINPFMALSKIFVGSFGSIYGLSETVTKSIPLIIISAGLSLAFKGKFWNIGAEGQILAGAISSAWIALTLGNVLSSFLLVPLMFLSGFIGGAIWGLFPAYMKSKYNINEVITTLMLNYIIIEIVQFLIYGSWKGVTQFGFPYTDNFSDSAVLAVIPGTRIHYITLILGLIIIVTIYILLNKTIFGYYVGVMGNNPEAARYAGINPVKVSIGIMMISGGLAGIAGTGEVAGIHHHLGYPWEISAGYGFTSIIVAFLAKLNPLFILISSFFISGILVGGDALQTSFGLPSASSGIFNGLILLSILAGDFFIEYKLKRVK